MKYNNVESLSNALEAAVQELVEVKRQLWTCRDELGDAKQKLEFANSELAAAEELLVLIDNWQARAEKAEDKFAACKRSREKDFELLISDFAYFDRLANELSNGDDDVAIARAEGRRDMLRSVVSFMYCKDIYVWHSGDMSLIEVGNGEDAICFYRWYMDMPMTKIEVK